MMNLLRLLTPLLFLALCISSTIGRADTLCSDTSSAATSGSLTDSGGASSNYSNNENCPFLIQPSGGGSITLSFSQFNYENDYDFVRIYNGTTTSAPLLGSFTDSSTPSDVTASSGAMRIVHSSDKSVTRSGFQATWSTTGSGGCLAQTVADNFNSVSYSLNNGSQNWSTNWLEIGESNGPSAGISRVNSSNCSSGNCLRIGQPSSASSWSNLGAQREVDLSSATAATLTFNYFTGYAQGTQSVTLEVSANGGSSWSPLATYNISGSSFSPTAQSFDISSHKATNTRIRFISSGTNARAGLYVDDIQISYTTSCPLPSPEAEWRFEEPNWNNSADEVLDSSGNNHHGTAINGTNTLNTTPALTGDPGTCRYGEFDGSNDYINIAHDSDLSITDELTITTWIRANQLPNSDLMSILSKNENYEFHLKPSGQINWWWISSLGTINEIITPETISTGTWHHIAIVYSQSNASQQIYIDGVASVSSRSLSQALATNTAPLQIGQDQNYLVRYFNGGIDEVRIYKSALTKSQIQTIMAERHACPVATVDHLSISHSGSAVTCAAETVTLSAHQSGHSVDTSYTQAVNLTTSTGRGDWSLISGNGTLNTGTANDGAASYNFVAGDNGSVQLGLSNTTIEVLNINASDGSISETSGSSNASDDPDLNFKASGLRFLANNTASAIGTQISGKNSNVTPGDQTLELQAIRTSAPNTCEAALINSHDIQLAYECRNPGTCSTGISATINDTNIGANISGSISNYSSVTLNFGDASDSTATFKLNYPDAGKIRLHARYNIPNTGLVTGSSNDFVVKPAGLCVEAIDTGSDCAVGNHNCSRFKKAGETFNLRIKGVAWESSGENNTDFCTGNIRTPNFQLKNIGLSSNLIAPNPLPPATPGKNAKVGVKSFNMDAANKGAHTMNTQSISEVGVFTITAIPSSYLGETIAASTSANIGRFYPDHFVINGGSVTEGCPSGNFTYLSQDFSSSYKITAQNANGATTENYRDDFIFLKSEPEAFSFGAIDSRGPTLLSGRISSPATSFSWNNDGTGILSSTLNLARLGVTGSTMADGPFITQIGVLPTDADGVTVKLNDRNLNSDNTGSNDHVLIGSSIQRYGRFVIDNAFGPEVLNLEIPLRTEYWEDSAFVINSDDKTACSGILFSKTNFTIKDPAPPPADSLEETDTSKSYSPITSGSGSLTLSAPNTSGPLNISLNVPDWLTFDFNGDNTDENPSAQAFFGQYRGNDRIIFWREQF